MMKRTVLLSSQVFALTQMLREDHYDTRALARRIREYCRGLDHHDSVLADTTLCALAMGHIDLSQALIDGGARPGSGEDKVLVVGDFQGVGNFVDGRGIGALHLLARLKPEVIERTQEIGGKMRSRVDVLAHVLANRDTWGQGVDDLYGAMTPLIASQWVDKHAGSLKHFPTGAIAGSVDLAERAAFQEALIQAGADINNPLSPWKFLGGSVPMAPANGSQDLVDMSEITRALALGADPVAGAAAAWSQAIGQDAGNGYLKGQGLGQRARALEMAGIGLRAGGRDPGRLSPIFTAFSTNARWAVEQMVGNGVDIGAWQDPLSGSTIAHLIPGMVVRSKKLLGLVPREQQERMMRTVDKQGNTPLHEAVAVLDDKSVKHYLALGSDPLARNRKGLTPLGGMRVVSPRMRGQFESIFKMLGAGNAAREGSLHKAALMLSVQACQDLLDRGISVHDLDESGRTPLEVALFGHQQGSDALFNNTRGAQQVRVMHLFASHGVDLFSHGEHGRTLLHEAMARGNHRVAIALLEAGADPNAEDEMGLTPMHLWGIFEHLRGQAKDKPELAGIHVPGRALSLHMVKPSAMRHIGEVMRAFVKAGGDVRGQRLGMNAFGAFSSHPELASALQAAQMDEGTAQAPAPSARPRRM